MNIEPFIPSNLYGEPLPCMVNTSAASTMRFNSLDLELMLIHVSILKREMGDVPDVLLMTDVVMFRLRKEILELADEDGLFCGIPMEVYPTDKAVFIRWYQLTKEQHKKAWIVKL